MARDHDPDGFSGVVVVAIVPVVVIPVAVAMLLVVTITRFFAVYGQSARVGERVRQDLNLRHLVSKTSALSS